MIIWLASYPRSGNTFFRVLMNSVFAVKTYSVYDDKFDIGADKKLSDVVGHEFLPDGFTVERARRSGKVFFLKTHDYPTEVNADDKVIYLLRDGRESVLSYYNFHKDYMDQSRCLLAIIDGDTQFGGWGAHVLAWAPATRPDTLLVKFEELVGDPLGQTERIAEFTGLKMVSDKLPTFDELRSAGPRFFRSGKTDSWKSVFSEFEHHAFWLRNYTQMIAYGYEQGVPEMFVSNPVEASYLSGKQLREQLPADFRENSPQSVDTGPAGQSRAEILCNQGEALFQKGDIEAAEARFLEAIRHTPGYADGYNNLGVLWWQKGAFEQALEYLTAGLRIVPDHRELVSNSAEVLLALGREQETRALCERYLNRNPEDNAIKLLMQGLEEPRSGQQDSQQSVVLNAEGEKSYLAGDNAHAEACFTRAHELNPGSVDVCNNLMVLYWQAGELEKAVMCLAQAMELEPTNRDVVQNGSQILASLDQYAEAEALCRCYLEGTPDDQEICDLLEALASPGSEGDGVSPTAPVPGGNGLEVIDYSLPENIHLAPSISIVVPSCNQAEYLEANLISILEQGYPGLELIVMDGGSSDRSVEIIKKYQDKITYWQSQQDEGQYWAVDKGIHRCRGDIITWLNSDDILRPGALNKVASIFTQCPDVEWLTGIPNTIDETGADKWSFPEVPVYCQQNYLKKHYHLPHYVQQEGTFWRRSLWEKAGGYLQTELKMAGDLELWARFFRYTPLYTVNGKTASFRQHEAQKTSAGMELYHKEAVAVLDRELGLFKESGQELVSPVAPLQFSKAAHLMTQSSLGSESHSASEIPMNDRASGRDISVATSIAPKSLEKQKHAIDSWLKLGMEVISVNVQSEIDVLADHFPGVRFVQASRDGRKRVGKPYVYINDILSVLRQSGKRVVGVINSDIILRAGEELNALLYREAEGSLLYASRIDIDQSEDKKGRFYHRGFDLFFMDRDVIRDMPDNSFMLGMPWWDYWFSCLMLTKGVTVKRIDNPGAFHLWHKPNYSIDNSVAFGADFVGVFAGLPFMHLHDQCVGIGLGKFRYSVLSDSALYHVSRNSQVVSLPVPESRKSVASGNPKVTAIVSTYASEAFIGECLQDLVNQTIADEIEILVIDAASPENERAVVESFQRSHPNIRYHRTPERIGIYAAWNLAVEMARGDYLISCSTNDRLRGDACEILSRSLDDQPDIALVYGNSFLTKEPHRNLGNAELCSMYVWPEYRYETLLDRSMVGPHPMWRRSVHDTVGYFDESFLALGDQDFWIRLGEQHKLLALPDFTGLYLVSEDSLTGNADVSRVEEDRVHMRWGWRYHYEKWFKSRLESPESVRCQDGPPVQVIVRSVNAGTNGIADTLDSVAEQAYSNWKLAVVADEACPDPLFDDHPQLDWVQAGPVSSCDERIDTLLDSIPDNTYIVFMEAGERLDALFLSDACAGLEQHPEWKMLYCDDDRVASDGELVDPRFKPDFNLDLLRSSDYVGNACLFRSEVVRVAGGAGTPGDARVFDLLLRMFDRFGRNAIGHLTEMRFHRSIDDTSCCEESIEQRRRALQAHLERCGEQALIEDAVIPGTFMLSYIPGVRPKVSILIEASNSGGGVANAVQSILSRTDYPDYEIRVLAGPAVPSAIIDCLQGLQKETAIVHLERCTHKISPSHLNQLARDCSGDLLLWLNENMLVLQDEWLARLVATGQRDGVGVVGVRVVNQKKILLGAGVIPGIGSRGAGSGMLAGLHMTSEGYMGRAQLAQETGAVSPLCMLVGKEQFRRVGEFDKALAVGLYRNIDFCERVRAEDNQVVWAPRVTLMYVGESAAIDGVPESEEQVDRETALLHERWLEQFAREPSFNRHLSLSRDDYGLDTTMPAAWNPELDSLPRVLSFGVGSYGSWRYRVTQPLDAMQGEGMMQRIHTGLAGKESIPLPTVIDLERLQPTTLLMHNTMHDDYIEAMEKYKRVNDVFIVFGQDDLMMALPPKNPFSKTVYKDMKCRVRKCLSLADRLVVTTEPLAQALKGMVDDICVVPNAIDESVWGALESSRRTGRKPRVGWAGAQQHQGDLELLEVVVRELADEVEWVFFGMCPAALRPWVSEVHEAVDFEAYPEKLAGLNLDLALAPLEHNRFNESKSNLRVLEYGVLGWPVIATDIYPYQSTPVCRVPNQPRAWINAIRERIHDCDAMAREGDLLRDWVRQNALLGQQLDAWMSALNLLPSSQGRGHLNGQAASL